VPKLGLIGKSGVSPARSRHCKQSKSASNTTQPIDWGRRQTTFKCRFEPGDLPGLCSKVLRRTETLRQVTGFPQANSRYLLPNLSSSPGSGTSVCSKSFLISRRSFTGALCALIVSSPIYAQQRTLRIVSTAPSITEVLFALGLGYQVVGVSRYCEFPASVQKLPKVGTYIKPDPEAIARLRPDLVILQRSSPDLTDRLNALHISFIEVPHGTLKDVFGGIQTIAQATGIAARGAQLIASINNSLNAIHTKAKGMPSPRLLAILDRKQGTLTDLTAVGPDNYTNQIFEIAGGANVLARPGLPHYPHISLETVIRENPDIILDLSSTQASEADRLAVRSSVLALWRENKELNAVRTGHVYFGTSNALLVPGPRAPEAAQTLFDFMHSAPNSGRAS
jgi:iron complex transport system substrate-binding protein